VAGFVRTARRRCIGVYVGCGFQDEFAASGVYG
jgi:hypothetical protein